MTATITKKKPTRTKVATKKKVTSVKKTAAPEAASSGIKTTTRLRVIKDSKRPKNAERARVKVGIVGTMTAEAIMKKLACRLKTLEIMHRHGYVEIVQ